MAIRTRPFLVRRGGSFRLRTGGAVALTTLSRSEILFVDWLEARAAEGEGLHSLLPAVTGPGAFPLRGKGDLDDAIRARPVFRVARDLLDRVGACEKSEGGEFTSPGSERAMFSVTEAAEWLGISRAAVVKAIQQQRLPAYAMG